MKLSFVLISLFALIVFVIPIATLSNRAEIEPVANPSSYSSSPSSSSSKDINSNSPVGAEEVPRPNEEEASVIEEEKNDEIKASTDEINTEKTALSYSDTKYFNILNQSTGKVQKVLSRDYVRGALAAEMPANFHIEAMKAQAVSAHTYALLNKQLQQQNPNPDLKGADFSADPNSLKGYMTEKQAKEFYGDNFEIYWKKICEAADTTLDTILVYEDEPILAAYHSTSTGMTEGAENVWTTSLPYLVPVESVGDKLSPNFEVTKSFTADEIQKKFDTVYDDIKFPSDKSKWFKILEHSEGGYITLIDAGNLTLHGKDVRTVLDLRSSAFTIAQKGNTFSFTTTGYGHGVGLSQYGADYMARQGIPYEEILLHYYQGASLGKLKD